ncbi:helix-turn-helix domain-containing protein [Wukongibacter baidiensis]|uniref:TetR/AcrR family transcriptional regulator n=1 Tax=Wukongibacter baidiensis TaxID=1723361 RepID=UPI003D7F7A5E
MPKIIKDIEENIFNAAFELFGEYGYKETDMKKIAKKAGIAVGTLYNYYSNKKELFLSVFEKSWKNTFFRIDSMFREKTDAKEKIRSFVEILYDEISKRKGLGSELVRENVIAHEKNEKFLFVKKELSNRMQALIHELRCNEELRFESDMDERLCFSLVTLTAEMTKIYPGERDTNLEFINMFIESIYKR